MWAAAENNAAVVKLLVEAGADVRERSRGGAFSPLLFAVRGGHVATALRAARRRRAGQRRAARRHVGARARGRERALRAGRRAARPRRRPRTRRRRAGRRCTRSPGRAGTTPASTCRDRCRPAPSTASTWRASWWRAAPTSTRGITKEPKDGNRNMLNRIGATPFLMAAKSDDVALMRVLLDLGADASLTTDARDDRADGGGRRRHLGARREPRHARGGAGGGDSWRSRPAAAR